MVLFSGKGMKMKVQKYEIARVIDKLKSMQEAEKIVKNHYEKAYRGEFQRDGWELEEVEFSDDGCSEIYYG